MLSYRWLSGHHSVFKHIPKDHGDAVIYSDNGRFAAAFWLVMGGGAAAIFVYAVWDFKFVNLLKNPYAIVFALMLSVCFYRGIRACFRSSKLALDPKTDSVIISQTWPRRIDRVAPLRESRVILRSVCIGGGQASWHGYALFVAVRDEQFAIAAAKKPEAIQKLIPEILSRAGKTVEEDPSSEYFNLAL